MDNLVAAVIGDVALVLAVSAMLGVAARRCGQPAIVGQIMAGILFGPSLAGHLPGHLTSHLFPRAALPYLTVISQIAVSIFMFVVGYELNRKSLSFSCRPALLVAASALIVPVLVGSGMPLVFRSSFAALGQPHFSHSLSLFMGVAMSVTALPVLSAIMRERGISQTTAGFTATMAAGLMDAGAWILLAVTLVGVAGRHDRPWTAALLLFVSFAAIMLLAVRPVLRWWICRSQTVLANQLPVALVLTLGSAWVTASIGLHPLSGALLAGVAMPCKGRTPDPDVLRPMGDVSDMLLPVFFVVTGLSVNISAMNGAAFLMLALLLAAATAGKIGPGYIASRIGGLSHRDAATVAVLVNTRGLTELVVLNVGLSVGLIGQQLFSVLVLTAVLTTLMTAPLLGAIRTPMTSSAERVESGQPVT